jgi:PIN domain nuclease of toxin-antitoxin system
LTPLLLDTHALVWLLDGDARLAPAARQRIDDAARQRQLWVSAITPWEIGMLAARGRLVLDRDVAEWVDAALALPGLQLAPLEPGVAVASTRLPQLVHADPADPADRIIVATARHLGAALVTADAALLAYGGQGYVAVVPAQG